MADGSPVFFCFFCPQSSFSFLCFLSLDRDLHLSPSPSLRHPELVHYYVMSCISLYLHILITYTLWLHIQPGQPKTRKSNLLSSFWETTLSLPLILLQFPMFEFLQFVCYTYWVLQQRVSEWVWTYISSTNGEATVAWKQIWFQSVELEVRSCCQAERAVLIAVFWRSLCRRMWWNRTSWVRQTDTCLI